MLILSLFMYVLDFSVKRKAISVIKLIYFRDHATSISVKYFVA